MRHLRVSPALALVLPLLLWGNPPASGQSRQEKTIVVEPRTPRQGWLGVQIQDLTTERAKELQVAAEEGALVTDVTADSPAEKGGIKKNDVVVEFNGRTIYDSDDLMKAVRRTKPGTSAAVVVARKEGKKNLQVTMGKLKRRAWTLGPGVGAPLFTPRMRFAHASLIYGMQLADLNRQLGEYFGAPEGEGVLVEEVEKESGGATAGFKAGDVILRIGDEKIEDLSDVSDALEDFKDGEKASVEILRKGSRQTLTLTVEEDEISGVYSLPPDAERALREDLHAVQEELGKIRVEFGPEFRERLRKDLEKAREEFGPQLRKELQEKLGKIRTEFGPEFQEQMRALKRELRALHDFPPESI